MNHEKPQRNLDQEIADALRAAEASGELRSAGSYGKPLDLGDGYEETRPRACAPGSKPWSPAAPNTTSSSPPSTTWSSRSGSASNA